MANKKRKPKIPTEIPSDDPKVHVQKFRGLSYEEYLEEPFRVNGLNFNQEYPHYLRHEKGVKFTADLEFRVSHIESERQEDSKHYSSKMIREILIEQMVQKMKEIVLEYDAYKALRPNRYEYIEREIKNRLDHKNENPSPVTKS